MSATICRIWLTTASPAACAAAGAAGAAARQRAVLPQPEARPPSRPAARGRLGQRRPVPDEPDDVRQGREVAELQVLITRDLEALPHRRENLGLLDGVDAQVGFEVEIGVEQISASNPSAPRQYPDGLLHRVSRRPDG